MNHQGQSLQQSLQNYSSEEGNEGGNRLSGIWNDDLVKRLKVHFENGLTASQIAADLGCVTRNAVIGKIFRLGLRRDKPKRSSNRTVRTQREPKAVTLKTPVLRVVRAGKSNGLRVLHSLQAAPRPLRLVEIDPRNLTLDQLAPNDCRYIAGDDHLFCGHPKQAGSSWCASHHALCYLPPKERFHG